MFFPTDAQIVDGTLKCPRCEDVALHHHQVEVFNREREDSERGTDVMVNGAEISINQSMYGNPSRRRNGIRIYFTCEFCDVGSDEDGGGIPLDPCIALTIYQHKGSTYMHWEDVESIDGNKGRSLKKVSV